MSDGWNVKRSICCARCGADVEFGLCRPADSDHHVLVVEGMRFDMFDIDGEGILTEEEYEPKPLCSTCREDLEKWFEGESKND